MWQVWRSGAASAEANMAKDRKLLADLPALKGPLLHLYDWEGDCATYGLLVNPDSYLNRLEGLQIAKRPTGGGVIFHRTDLAFSVLLPFASTNTLENYAFVNGIVLQAINRFLGRNVSLLPFQPVPLDKSCERFCMAHPTQYDIMLEGRKVGGAAQRQTRHGILHQGSIFLSPLPEEFLKAALKPVAHSVLVGIQENAYPLLPSSEGIQEARRALQCYLEEIVLSFPAALR